MPTDEKHQLDDKVTLGRSVQVQRAKKGQRKTMGNHNGEAEDGEHAHSSTGTIDEEGDIELGAGSNRKWPHGELKAITAHQVSEGQMVAVLPVNEYIELEDVVVDD